ncbi:hypothetical protein [Propionivibrio sp.]|uniref:hypothetical protein n=1 Tax=Propionivibrio sp. TaxID=2212460 RepID=UPI003BF423B6
MTTNTMPVGAGTDTPRFSNSTSKPHPYRVRPHQPAASNAVTSLIASFEMAGHKVLKDNNGGFNIVKFGLVRYCKDQTDLIAFAKIVGVQQ